LKYTKAHVSWPFLTFILCDGLISLYVRALQVCYDDDDDDDDDGTHVQVFGLTLMSM